MEKKEILTVATDVGYMLLSHGAEVYRTEEAIQYICESYGVDNVDVFAIPTSIVVTISFDGDFITKTRRVSEISIDLDKVDKVNELSRYICKNNPSFEEIQNKINEIKSLKTYSKKLKVFATCIIGFCFALMFGGGFIEAVLSFIIGAIVAVLTFYLDTKKTNTFLKTTFCSFVISLIAMATQIFIYKNLIAESVIAGSLMILVPGLAITNCMRDFMANDYIAGIAKLTEALMTAIATALGVSIVLLTVYQFGGV